MRETCNIRVMFENVNLVEEGNFDRKNLTDLINSLLIPHSLD